MRNVFLFSLSSGRFFARHFVPENIIQFRTKGTSHWFWFFVFVFFFGVSTGKTSFCSITLAVVQHRQIARKFYVIISYSRDRTITDYNRIGVGEDIMRERENKCNFSQSKEIIEKKNREDGPAALSKINKTCKMSAIFFFFNLQSCDYVKVWFFCQHRVRFLCIDIWETPPGERKNIMMPAFLQVIDISNPYIDSVCVLSCRRKSFHHTDEHFVGCNGFLFLTNIMCRHTRNRRKKPSMFVVTSKIETATDNSCNCFLSVCVWERVSS